MGKLIQALEEQDLADNTLVIFLADNGTGKRKPGGKGTMTDRGTHDPLIDRWPGHIIHGSSCDDLIDFSDFFRAPCGIGGNPETAGKMDVLSFLPQLLGEAGETRSRIHVQDRGQRHVRSREYIPENEGGLPPVVELWNDPSETNSGKLPDKEHAAKEELRAVFDELGK